MTAGESFGSGLDQQLQSSQGQSEVELVMEEVTAGCWYAPGFANVGVVLTSEGVLVIDTSLSRRHAEQVRGWIRSRTDLAVKALVYTHGHFDHVNGADALADADTRVIAHENVPDRFRKYRALHQHIERINGIQFGRRTDGERSFDFHFPDTTFHHEHEFRLGDKTIHLRHGRGETEDHCFVHVLEDDLIYCGDFFIWSFPNIGNPLKVVRFEREWFESLEQIRDLEPEFLVPGHGKALAGRAVIRQALQDVVDCLRLVHEHVIEHLNRGTSLEDMLQLIEVPPHLRDSPYVQQTYGSVDFAVRGTHRRYAGWFHDENPTHLDPCKAAEVCAEIAALLPSQDVVIERARALMSEGRHRMALHLLDVLVLGSGHEEARRVKTDAVRACADATDNFIAGNIYRQLADPLDSEDEG